MRTPMLICRFWPAPSTRLVVAAPFTATVFSTAELRGCRVGFAASATRVSVTRTWVTPGGSVAGVFTVSVRFADTVAVVLE
jgi:hypothetical protein